MQNRKTKIYVQILIKKFNYIMIEEKARNLGGILWNYN
ncbi:MAG: hypothetical protein PWR23_1616 [Peptostreptococcaceae bacterium]|jgi:hypothetical protein|nr:hypothetical protein [Peptostreptococcaceae bacterium]